jgi:tetratricopeptide (TPR) repeat protein
MRFRASLFLTFFGVLAIFVITGCDPPTQTQSDEQKEPHFLAGKSRINTLDYEGAIDCFEKSLEVNPQSAAAHFELGCVFDQHGGDPASAIYHYQTYLKLRPNPGNIELVKQRVLACKQLLARTVSLGPVTKEVQKELDQLSQETKKLTEENKTLRGELEKMTAYAVWLQGLTNQPASYLRTSAGAPANAGAPTTLSQSSKPLAGTTISSRNHVVKPGETPTVIARKYGVRLEALLAANPKLDARRLRVGQTIAIPNP